MDVWSRSASSRRGSALTGQKASSWMTGPPSARRRRFTSQSGSPSSTLRLRAVAALAHILLRPRNLEVTTAPLRSRFPDVLALRKSASSPPRLMAPFTNVPWPRLLAHVALLDKILEASPHRGAREAEGAAQLGLRGQRRGCVERLRRDELQDAMLELAIQRRGRPMVKRACRQRLQYVHERLPLPKPVSQIVPINKTIQAKAPPRRRKAPTCEKDACSPPVS